MRPGLLMARRPISHVPRCASYPLIKRAVALAYRAAPALLLASVVLVGRQRADRGSSGPAWQVRARGPFEGQRRTCLDRLGDDAVPRHGRARRARGVMSVVAGQIERVLGERVQREMLRKLIDVSVSVDLEAYEDPAFFDHQQRVLQNAAHRPDRGDPGSHQRRPRRRRRDQPDRGTADGRAAPAADPALHCAAAGDQQPSRQPARVPLHRRRRSPLLRKRYYLQGVLTSQPGAKEVRAFGLADADHASAGTTAGGSTWPALRTHVGAARGSPSLGGSGRRCSRCWRSSCWSELVAHHEHRARRRRRGRACAAAAVLAHRGDHERGRRSLRVVAVPGRPGPLPGTIGRTPPRGASGGDRPARLP